MAPSTTTNGSGKDSSIDIKAQCLCKKHSFTATVPLASLPLKATACHCDSCRYNTGALYSADADWPGDPAAVRESGLSVYYFSDNINVLFCGRCGSTMFFEQKEPGKVETSYAVCTGALPNVELPGGGPLVTIEHHMFLDDTKDGGASPWLRNTDYDVENGCYKAARRWHGRRFKSDEILEGDDWPSLKDLSVMTGGAAAQTHASDSQELGDITIPVKCRCGGVHVELLASVARKEFSQMPRDQLPRFVDPDNNKSIASFDVCDSCRTVSGLDIFHWTFFWLKHIRFPQDAASSSRPVFPESTAALKKAVLQNEEERDPGLGALRMYESSPDVQRYFCGGCSAVVFYAVDDLANQVDVALGLLRAPPVGKNTTDGSDVHGGARAEHLLSWKFGGSMGWQQDVQGGWRDGLVKIVTDDVTAWRDKRGLAKNWRV
ncbi:uncharacterized protein B0I36DRAFT_341866 [Microdochium trichocladiopsis]|uniref:CENP-V/GFA domain-containing protein n=1 Tax=Microdochium trichocladiopsis TaxID=1682393 RepID=A0A9P8XRJ0_9PEZI|nr:uncharacterized protein B0I36DRAFT_341866 [Microdochium trichocladiopsis]KAH7010642.1 hypothetical protein B0I36DRAFT_341866 [Microdochium trichocladiopsis]